MLLRRRPPGAVQLSQGQREHMLFVSSGRPAENGESRSVLRWDDGVREWQRPPTGQVTFIPAGTPFDWEWTYHSESIHLILAPEFVDPLLEQLAEEGPRPTLRPLIRATHAPLRRLLLDMRDEAREARAGRGLALESFANLAAVTALRSAEPGAASKDGAPPGLTRRELQQAIDLIEDRVAEPIALAELAAAAGVSVYHFARAFKRATGHPPHDYQLRRRVERAKALLTATPRQSVSEIAAALGFADESHLRRHFKRIVGTTPGRFRG